MKEEDWWIGDNVLLKKSGRKGKYMGKNPEGKHKVQVGSKVVVTTLSNMQLLDDDAPQSKSTVISSTPSGDNTHRDLHRFNGKTIDLHIEILRPQLTHATAFQILAYQLKETTAFLDYAVHHKLSRITIIHGKGEGVLKSEVHHLLDLRDDIHSFYAINEDGATEVWLK